MSLFLDTSNSSIMAKPDAKDSGSGPVKSFSGGIGTHIRTKDAKNNANRR